MGLRHSDECAKTPQLDVSRKVPGNTVAYHCGPPDNNILRINSMDLNSSPMDPREGIITTIRGHFIRDVGPNWRFGFTFYCNGRDPIAYKCGPGYYSDFKVMQDSVNTKNNPKKGDVVAIAERWALPVPWMNRAEYTIRAQWWDSEGCVVMDVAATYEFGEQDGEGWGLDPNILQLPDSD